MTKVTLMSQQRLTESQEKTKQQIAGRETGPASTRSLQEGAHPILPLQRTLGNRRVARLIQAKRLTSEGKPIVLQRKLTVGAADDQYEREADRVAHQVLSMSDTSAGNSAQRAISPQEEKDQRLQTKPLAASITQFVQREMVNQQMEGKEKPAHAKSVGALAGSFEASADIETQVSQSNGRGSPLPDSLRAYMEPRFGVDFSAVRVHTGSEAVQMNRDVGAQAFTHGSDIYFGGGSNPGNLELTAHELTHVVQQTGGVPLRTKRLEGRAAPPGPEPSIQRICPACTADAREEKGAAQISRSIQGKSGGNLIQRIATTQETFAGLFELTRHNPLGGPTFAPQVQYDVRIEFRPYQVVDCDQIGMTQTILSSTGGVLTPPSAAARARQLAAGEGTVGVTIDRLSGRTSPLYGRDNTGLAAGNAHFGKRTGTGKGDKAWMTDLPGWDGATAGTSRTAGVPDSSHFELCAICNAGKDQGVYYGCVNWGYSVDAANKFTEDNFALVSKGTPSADFLAAAKKWNDQTVPVATDDLPLPTHKTKQTSMTEAQLKAEIATLQTTLKGLAAGNVDIPQISFEIKVYKDILEAMAYNNGQGFSQPDIKAIQAVVDTTPNGTFDFDTILKIKRWQVENSLKGDGRFGSVSKAKFDAIVKAAVTANKAKGFTADQIKKIQVEVGSNDDGSWGPITVKQLMVWQKTHSLLATGEFYFFTKFKMFGLFGL